MLKVTVAEGLMDHPPGTLRVFRRRADDMHYRHVLGIAAGYRVRGRQFANPECRDQSRHSAQPPVAVGGVSGVQLVGVTYPANPWMGDNVVEKLQVEVAGHAEHLGNTQFDEAVQQVVADRISRFRQATTASTVRPVSRQSGPLPISAGYRPVHDNPRNP